jgi:LysM repeat protein
VEQPEPEAAFSTLQRGDTLSKIAGKHYGNASKYPLIFKANQPILKDPDKIYPAQKLRIPPWSPKPKTPWFASDSLGYRPRPREDTPHKLSRLNQST